jgi:putative nucleotidyltransferase with HDIG domain
VAGSLLDRINHLIETGSLDLPVCNPSILRLQEVLADDAQKIDEIEKMIMMDQALAAEILRAANSPFYCGLSPIRTVRNAIVRLGTQQVQRLMVLGLEHAKYRAHDPQLDKLLKEIWKHASTTALAAQWLAKRLGMGNMEEVCFLAGLLHDIGKLVAIRAVDDIKKSEGPGFAVSYNLLREILTTTHCELGYKLLRGWNLPDDYCTIVRDHHIEEVPPDMFPLAIVRLANESSKKLGVGLDPNPDMILAATAEANMLKTSELLLAELEIMLEDHLSQTGQTKTIDEKPGPATDFPFAISSSANSEDREFW